MASVPIITANLDPEVISVKRQLCARAAGEYEPPMLQHVGNEADALLAVRLDPSKDDSDAGDHA